VCLGSANTDDTVFRQPEAFNPERLDLLKSVEHKSGFRTDAVAGHLGFGLGAHFCMGYQLARAEIVTATEALLDRVADLTWDVDEVPALEIDFFVRTVPSLPVRFTARPSVQPLPAAAWHG
jgi:cytochrome P450